MALHSHSQRHEPPQSRGVRAAVYSNPSYSNLPIETVDDVRTLERIYSMNEKLCEGYVTDHLVEHIVHMCEKQDPRCAPLGYCRWS